MMSMIEQWIINHAKISSIRIPNTTILWTFIFVKILVDVIREPFFHLGLQVLQNIRWRVICLPKQLIVECFVCWNWSSCINVISVSTCNQIWIHKVRFFYIQLRDTLTGFLLFIEKQKILKISCYVDKWLTRHRRAPRSCTLCSSAIEFKRGKNFPEKLSQQKNYSRKKSIGFQNSICRESDMASSEESCLKGLKNVLANTVRGVALAVWGTQPRDRMLIAEMSVSASIGELVQAENTTKQELSIIVERVRATQLSKSKSGLKDLLLKSRVLRGTLANINKKRMSMEKQLETLRQSQLNQSTCLCWWNTQEKPCKQWSWR